MITKNDVEMMMAKAEALAAAEKENKAIDFIENVVEPCIFEQAKKGWRDARVSIKGNVDLYLVASILTHNGFTAKLSYDQKAINVYWPKD